MKKIFTLLLLIYFGSLNRNYAQSINGGASHSLALCNNNTVRAWGYNNQGQLGDSTIIDKLVPVSSAIGLTDVIAIEGGGNHSLALKSDGTVWAWGDNYSGELGDGTATDKLIPVQVTGLTDIISISSKSGHSLALKNDGTVWAWGHNGYGELGDGTTVNKNIPVQVIGLTNIIGVSTGLWHSLALKNDGTVWTWGANNTGQLGDGTTTSKLTPVQVSGLTNIIAIAGGYGKPIGSHSLALKSDGTVWAWGHNYYGQLGDGTTTNRTSPVQVTGLNNMIKIEAGTFFSIALKSDGTVWAWGNNSYGQLGDGTTTGSLIPVETLGLINISLITSGGDHSLALKSDGTVWTWGYNYYGQLGDGTTTDRTIPVQAINLCQVKLPNGVHPHFINSYLYDDVSNDCDKQLGETGLSFPIIATPGNFYSVANDSGYYSLGLNDSVNYTITPVIPQRFSHMASNLCPSSYSIYLDANNSKDTTGFDFGFEYNPCHQLRVDISSNRRRRCFRNITSVYYTNEGLIAANGVEVRVKMPEYVIPISASLAYTWNSSDSSMVFSLGTLNAGQSGFISITDSVACINSITGLTQCTEAWITPPNTCLINSTTGSGWDKSSVAVEGACVNDTVCFVIYNTGDPGTGDMQGISEYRIYADNKLKEIGNFQIVGGDSLVIYVVSGGATIRLEADQRPGHPGYSLPRETVEVCGTSGTGSFSLGMVNQAPMDDADVDVEIDCLTIIDSYDPNDKSVSPEGAEASHIVLPNTLLDYTIRFQNTGTDTAYKVIVIDTLSQYLDLSTLEPGTSSYPYILNITGEGLPVLKFTFSNINLTDTFTNELRSHGFVKFKIAPYASTPIGTLINNKCDIYFDYNFPIKTNSAWVTLENYSPCVTDTVVQNVSICTGDSITVRTSIYKISGTYTDSLIASDGCDSIVITNLTVNAHTVFSQNPVICEGDTFTVGINAYTISGAYMDTLINTANCDSIVTTNLTVLSHNSFSQNPFICSGDSFIVGASIYKISGTYFNTLTAANGCDSIVTTNLTVNSNNLSQNLAICEGDSIMIGSSIYKVSGTYLDTLININGCDSVVTTKLTVNSNTFSQNLTICNGDSVMIGSSIYKVSGTYLDTLVDINGCDSTIITILTVNFTYTDTNTVIINIGDSIIVGSNIYTAGGTYIDTLIASNNCDSVITTNITVLTGIKSAKQQQYIMYVYPNPTTGDVTINTRKENPVESIILYSIEGKKVFEKAEESGSGSINVVIQHLSQGIYFLECITKMGSAKVKVVKY